MEKMAIRMIEKKTYRSLPAIWRVFNMTDLAVSSSHDVMSFRRTFGEEPTRRSVQNGWYQFITSPLQ
jgi:hypothetical protein